MRKQDQKYLDEHLKTRSIWQGKNGSWNTRWEEQDGRVRLVSKRKKEDLESAIIAHYKEIENAPIISRVYHEWIEERMAYKEIEVGTFDRTNTDFKRFFEGTGFAKKRIDLVTEDDLTAFIKGTICDFELTSKAWANLKGIILGIFSYAKTKKYTDFSISSYLGDLHLPVNIFKKRTVDDDTQVFTDEELNLIFNWIREDEERSHALSNLGILLALCTGLRAGELSTLKYSDVKGNILTVCRTETRHKDENGEYVFPIREYTKGKDGIRKVVLPEVALKIIETIREVNPNGEYLFMHDGHRMKGDRFSGKLKRICGYIGIPPRSLHKLRKTYACILIDSGCPDGLITRQMGHTDIRITLGHYYFSRKTHSESTEEINTAFGEMAI